jgi:cellulose biosynthesis protein BcsQ
MQVVSVKSKKGGIGKSMFSRELAQLLAALGLAVALFDFSEQSNDDILENQQRPFPYTLKECVISDVPLRDALRQVRKNLWLLAGSRDHEDINGHIRKVRYQDMMVDMLEDLRASLVPARPYAERFDWWQTPRVSMQQVFRTAPTTEQEFGTAPVYLDIVLIDSDASTEDDLTLITWDAIDGILLPYEPTELDWQSYHQLKGDLTKRYVRRPQSRPPILGILPNKVLHTKDDSTPLAYLKTLYRDAQEKVFQPVHWSKIFGQCLNQHIGCLDHPQAHTDRAVRELCAIALELIGYEGDLVGLKFCDKCTREFREAMQEGEERDG